MIDEPRAASLLRHSRSVQSVKNLRLPSRAEPTCSDGDPVPGQSRRESVLLVDDSPDNRLMLREFLGEASYDIEEANNGAIAVAKVQLRKYDFIVMDLLMPEMDGFEAMRRIRAWENSRPGERACIIALTAWTLKEAELESLGSGADIYLTKPIRRAKLLEVLAAQRARIAAANRA
jgi:CheY-like chemotaxis protein